MKCQQNSAKSCAVILQNTQTIPLNSFGPRFIYSKCHHPPQTHAAPQSAYTAELAYFYRRIFCVPLKADTRKTPYIGNRILYDSIFTRVNCCVFPCQKSHREWNWRCSFRGSDYEELFWLDSKLNKVHNSVCIGITKIDCVLRIRIFSRLKVKGGVSSGFTEIKTPIMHIVLKKS